MGFFCFHVTDLLYEAAFLSRLPLASPDSENRKWLGGPYSNINRTKSPATNSTATLPILPSRLPISIFLPPRAPRCYANLATDNERQSLPISEIQSSPLLDFLFLKISLFPLSRRTDPEPNPTVHPFPLFSTDK